MMMVPSASTARVFIRSVPFFLKMAVEPSAWRVTPTVCCCAFFAFGVVMRKCPSANSSMELNSCSVLPSPQVFTSILMASLAYCSSALLPSVNSVEGFAPSGNCDCFSLSSLSHATKPNEAMAIINE